MSPSFLQVLVGLFFSSWLVASGTAQAGSGSSNSPWASLSPPALPLAVRSPYLNAWLVQGNASGPIVSSWPSTWDLKNVLGWFGGVQVDGISYQVLGNAVPGATGMKPAIQNIAEFSATRTSFLITAGAVDLNLTFLSPIEPTDLVRQSTPFSYVYMDISSNDGQPHDVKVYSDISAEWISGDDLLIANWTSTVDGIAVILKTQLENPIPFSEIANHAQDAVAYYAMQNQSGISWQIGQDTVVRSGFNKTGALSNSANNTFRAVSDDFPVFGISVDLGTITSTKQPVVWAIGLVRDPCVQYRTSSGQIEDRSSYYWSQYSTDVDLVESFLSDFDRALNAAVDFDTQLMNNASSEISSEYADLLALAVRQTLGSLDITLSKDENGDWNMSDVKVFMKNFSPVGESGGVNAVDVLFSAFPTYITLNPDLAKYLLTPLLELQESPIYADKSALHDLGSNYPNATAQDPNPSGLGVEESANMLIMGLAHAQTSGDGSLITSHYNLFKQWADYLVNNTLLLSDQFTSDALNAANQTNLAIKGIIGIRAMSIMSQYGGQNDDAAHYQDVSNNYLDQWLSMAVSSDKSHILGDFNEQLTSGLIYNLYADKLLQLGFIPDSIYEAQSSFYAQQISGSKYGIPFDSSELLARSDWTLLTAATITDNVTRNNFISFVHNYAAANQSESPLSLLYDPASGQASGGSNSPAQGAMFALMALNVPIQTLTSNSGDSSSSGGSSTNVGAIVGGVLGTLAAISCFVALFFFFRRRRQQADRINAVPYLETRARNNGILSPGLSYEPFNPAATRPDAIRIDTSVQPRSPGPFSHTPYSIVESGGVMQHHRTGSEGIELQSPATTYPGTLSEIESSFWRTAPPSLISDTSASTSTYGRQPGSTRSRVMKAKQTLVNEELRMEVDNLRREMDRIREERVDNLTSHGLDMPPPSYDEA